MFALLPTLLAASLASPGTLDVCRVIDAPSPEFYQIVLVTTGRVPGARIAKGMTEVTFSRSPFGITLTEQGDYLRDLTLSVSNLRPLATGAYVVWVTTPSLDQVERLGVLSPDGKLEGQVGWNKFLVVITLESDDGLDQARWEGPIVLRGVSKSGAMHSSLGHGPFEQENCSSVGFIG